MKLQTFKNMTGLIHGSDPRQIGCDKEGVLKIGATEIALSPERESVVPILFDGWTGKTTATFTDADGNIYDLGQVSFKAGRIVSPAPEFVKIAELQGRVDIQEKEISALWERIQELSNLFDTNSLNFLIK